MCKLHDLCVGDIVVSTVFPNSLSILEISSKLKSCAQPMTALYFLLSVVAVYCHQEAVSQTPGQWLVNAVSFLIFGFFGSASGPAADQNCLTFMLAVRPLVKQNPALYIIAVKLCCCLLFGLVTVCYTLGPLINC